MGKKNPYVFTIGFDKSDPDHVYVTDLLNATDKKAKLIVAAVLTYEGRTEKPDVNVGNMEPELFRPIIQEIIREEVRKALNMRETIEPNKEVQQEVDLMEEEPLPVDEALFQNVVDAISAFRRA